MGSNSHVLHPHLQLHNVIVTSVNQDVKKHKRNSLKIKVVKSWAELADYRKNECINVFRIGILILFFSFQRATSVAAWKTFSQKFQRCWDFPHLIGSMDDVGYQRRISEGSDFTFTSLYKSLEKNIAHLSTSEWLQTR